MSRTETIGPVQGGGSFLVAWRLEARRVLVVGGGPVAAGRVRKALVADASVQVVAPRLGPELRRRWQQEELDWRPGRWQETDLDGVDMVMACLDDPAVSLQIAAACRARRIPVNCADLPDLCDFWFTSEHRDGPLQVAISTNGQGPALGSRLAREVAAALPAAAGRALTGFGKLRRAVRRADPTPENGGRRMPWLTAVAQRWSWEDLAALDTGTVQALVRRYLAGDPPPPAPRDTPRDRPTVTLVGAGPGDPDLLTVAARRALQRADVVLADRLVSTELLALARGEVRIARKPRGRADQGQAELDAWTVAEALAGRDVVRLKCGDPFLFGRGGEEVAALAAAGIDAVVVPGITSALSAPLLAGIPATWRTHADRVLVLTAQGRGGSVPSAPAFDADTTYVWLMGVGRLPDLAAELQVAGFPPDWPAAIIERASRPGQRVLQAPLAQLPAAAQAASVAAPAVIVVGRVVAAAQAAADPAALLAVG